MGKTRTKDRRKTGLTGRGGRKTLGQVAGDSKTGCNVIRVDLAKTGKP